jgi:Tfp pilus assembly protein PilX
MAVILGLLGSWKTILAVFSVLGAGIAVLWSKQRVTAAESDRDTKVAAATATVATVQNEVTQGNAAATDAAKVAVVNASDAQASAAATVDADLDAALDAAGSVRKD